MACLPIYFSHLDFMIDFFLRQRLSNSFVWLRDLRFKFCVVYAIDSTIFQHSRWWYQLDYVTTKRAIVTGCGFQIEIYILWNGFVNGLQMGQWLSKYCHLYRKYILYISRKCFAIEAAGQNSLFCSTFSTWIYIDFLTLVIFNSECSLRYTIEMKRFQTVARNVCTKQT